MDQELQGKRLLILGGMRISCEIVREAKALGIYTLVADYNKIEASPGKQIADEAVELSVTDVDAVVNYVKDHDINGVFVGFNDMLLPYYADICEKAGLPCYGTKAQFDTLISKDRYKALCRQFGVPTIPEYDINDESIRFPVLVKPVDSSGSRGITICHNRQELDKAVEIGEKVSKTKKVLVERYIKGREVTAFWIFQNSNYHLSALANRHIKHNQGISFIPLPVGYTFPSVFLPKYQRDVVEPCKKLFRHLGIKNGMMFMQCKVEGDVCYLYDLGFRLTGSLEYKILKRVCGYNPLEMMIRHSLTGKMGDEDISGKVNPFFATPAFNVSCLCAPGTIKEIKGIETVKTMEEVEDVILAHVPGETITDNTKGLLTQITVRILGSVKKREDLFPVMKKIDDAINIVGEDGEELLLPGIEFNDIEEVVI